MSKKDFLMDNGTFNKNHSKVKALRFSKDRFFDPMDIVQVKYEMLKEVEERGASITDAADAYGFSRTAFYGIREAFGRKGVAGLAPRRPGPLRPHKLPQEHQERIDAWIAESPLISSGEVARLIGQTGLALVNRRTVERYRSKKKL
jgi:transposase